MQDLENLFNEKGKRINKYLKKLFPEEKQIIELHYGLNGIERLTMFEIANKLNISPEEVRNIEASGLRELKNNLSKKSILKNLFRINAER